MNGQESTQLINTMHTLISNSNGWEQVTKFFCVNRTGKIYFDNARQEVLDSGNQGYATMIMVALQNMAERIEDANEEADNADVNKLQSKIYKLESENRKLKSRIDGIQKLLGE